MTQYNIGQVRFQGSGCVNEIKGISVRYVNVSTSNDSSSSESDMSFKDVGIYPDSINQFSKGADYYLRVRIPQDMNYNMTFNIKLKRNTEDDGSTAYQFIKNVTVQRGGSANNVHTVCLYEKSDGTVDACIPVDYDKNKVGVRDMLYTDKTNYYLGTGTSTYIKTNNYNDVSLVESWKTETADTYGIFEMIFRPIEDNFTHIVLEMERDPTDYNIQRTDDDGNTEYGRKIVLNAAKDIELYQLVNQVPSAQATGTGLSRIGVWGHPSLLMAINGEEIRIGPSGYYEQDVVAVNSVGIVATSWKDNWTMDYEYQINETEESE